MASDPIRDLASRRFGIPYLYPYQRFVVANTLDTPEGESRHQLVILPTGAGKTLCFQLPALLLTGLTIVVYPLLSLMADQFRRAKAASIPAALLKGGMSSASREVIAQDVKSGATRLLITNPEMLGVPWVRSLLGHCTIAHLVIDEAHCVTEWGTTFRPSYLTLKEVVDDLPVRVVTAFTATASRELLGGIVSAIFGDRPVQMMIASPDRPNISYSVTESVSPHFSLRTILGPDGLHLPALVFCRSRARVEEVARSLSHDLGHERVGAYHAGMDPEERKSIEGWFFDSDDGVLVATCAYGMGVDKKNVRTTVHFDLPPSVEAFLQESGRAGRDGRPAESVVLWSGIDPAGNEPADPGTAVSQATLLRARAELVRAYCRTPGCRRDFLMRALGAESVPCFGCDSCRTAGSTPPGEADEILTDLRNSETAAREAASRWVRKHRRLFTLQECSWRMVADSANKSGTRTALPRWLRPEIEELLRTLVRTGFLRICSRWPWRYRLTQASSGAIVDP